MFLLTKFHYVLMPLISTAYLVKFNEKQLHSFLQNNAINMLVIYEDFLKLRDPRLDEYFLMPSPIPVATILLAYLIFVLKIGPEWMKNNAPVNLDKVIQIYNLLQILANGLLFISVIPTATRMSFTCAIRDPTNYFEMHLFYVYFLIKLFDLSDTIFFVLRKKNDQVTFLHVYHHTFMVIVTWTHAFVYPGGPTFWLGFVNTFVHAIMYFYYFLTSVTKQDISWKKYITQLQIAQHCFLVAAFLGPFLLKECPYSKVFAAGWILQAIHMIYMFSKFYIKTYVRGETGRKRE